MNNNLNAEGLAKYIFWFTVVILGILLNVLALRYFNTLAWPTLSPIPIIYILIVLFLVMLRFPNLLSSVWTLRIVGLFVIFIGQSYILHSIHVTLLQPSLLAVIHLIGILGMFFTVLLNFINQARPKDNKIGDELPERWPYVAVVVPTYNEPISVIEKTIRSVTQLDYPSDRMFVLISDDGRRTDIWRLAQKYGVAYHLGPRKHAKAGNLNSALVYLETHFPQGQLILTQDADELVDPSFLMKTIGYFNDPRVALVQTPKESITPQGDPFGTRDRIFYDVLQVGRNGANAAFACGSGVIWRIDAVKSIGGFSTWNIVEDLTTSYFLHCKGYRSEYHNEVLSVGLAPDDIPNLLKQRGTWAADTWRLFLYENPIFKPGLTLAQRLQYLELGTFYITSVFFTPMLMLVPALSLATGLFLPIEGSALFPWVGVLALYYIVLSRGQGGIVLRHWQYWIGHWPTYTQGLLLALGSRDRKPQYKVTRKVRRSGFYGQLLWPQFLYLITGAILIVRALFYMPQAPLFARITNIVILLFFMCMVSRICLASFYGVDFSSSIKQMVPSTFPRPGYLSRGRFVVRYFLLMMGIVMLLSLSVLIALAAGS